MVKHLSILKDNILNLLEKLRSGPYSRFAGIEGKDGMEVAG